MNSKLKKTLTAMLSAAILLSALSGCGRRTGQSEEEPLPDLPDEQYDETDLRASDKVFSLNCDKSFSFNPFSTTNASNILCTQVMYDQLFDVDESFNATGKLVSSFSSEDGITWRFYIDDTVKFWDGSTLTAADASYSVQRAMQSPQFKSRLKNVIGCSAADSKQFIITLSGADMLFPAVLAIPVIKYGTVAENAPMGTGPYMPNADLTQLDLFPEHKLAANMPTDTIYLKEFKQIESVITAFENSEIDLVTNDPTGFFNVGYGTANETRYYSTTHMHYLGFNVNQGFFSVPAARKAMTYVVDREHIVVDIMNGAATAATLPMHPACQYYNDKFSEIVSYSAAKSQAAFDEAQVQDYDDDGFREIMVNGIPMETDMKFIVCNDSPIKVSAARAIADNMVELGLKVTLYELPWLEYNYTLNQGDFNMYYAETSLTADFNLRELLLYGGRLNYGKVNDQTLTDNVNAYLASLPDTRQMAADMMFKYITDTAPIVPICFERQQVLTHRGAVSGLSPTQYNIFRNMENWEIDVG